MRYFYRILFILCFLCIFSASAEAEKQAALPPNPIDLSPKWLDYFSTDTQLLPDQIQTFIQNITAESKKLSIENQKIAAETIKKITIILQVYQQLNNTILPQPQPPPPILNTYTINQAIEIHHNILKQKVNIEANQTQEKDELRQIAITNQYLNALQTRYSDAESRSEEKFLLGLDVILYTITLNVADLNLKHIKTTALTNEQNAKNLSDELEAATERLTSSPEELEKFRQNVEQTEQVWLQTKENLQQKEQASIAASTDIISGEKGEAEQQELILTIRKSLIQEASAHNQMILATLQYQLSYILNNPTSANTNELDSELKVWNDQLRLLKRNVRDWKNRSERILQQYTQILSLNTEDIRGLESEVRLVVQNAQQTLLIAQQLESELSDSFFILDLLEDRLTNLVSTPTLWAWKIADFFKNMFSKIGEWLNVSLIQISPQQSITLASILRFLFVMLIVFWIARLARKALKTIAQTRQGISKSLLYRVGRLFQYFIYAVGLFVAFSTMGFDFSNLVIVLGALGVGLGFGLQSIFNNFISGIIILFESQLKVGDYVELEAEGLRGEIREINVRNTIIVTNDGTDVVIPNSQIIGNRIINWTLREPYRRIHVPFSVSYGTDKELVKQVVIDAAKNVPSTLIRPSIPEPRVYLTKFGDNGLEFELVVWVDEPSTRRHSNTTSAYLWAIDTAFRKHGIQTPFPQRDIHIKTQK